MDINFILIYSPYRARTTPSASVPPSITTPCHPMIRVRARIAAPVSRYDPHWPMHWPRHSSSRTAGTRSHIRHIGRSIDDRSRARGVLRARAIHGFLAKQVGELTICRVSSTVQLQVELISNWTTKSILELRIGFRGNVNFCEGETKKRRMNSLSVLTVLSTKRTQFFYFFIILFRVWYKDPNMCHLTWGTIKQKLLYNCKQRKWVF